MMVAIIAAMGRNRVIGNQGKMPWHLPEDLRRFRELTTGHTIVMGRKTFESIGKALPDRSSIVISNNRKFTATGCQVAGSVAEALALGGAGQIFICGGGMIYRDTIELADVINLTVIDADFDGDTFFPEIPPCFTEESREPLATSPAADFVVYRRTGRIGSGEQP
ncbi:MAG: dihydrofolate reductase [Geobacter sp.]|nr:dihydrofolate reductase [Geobacter sp.]